ncbi:MAG: hypothetical protein J4F36_08155 [Nitrosopumilaceae archaeon]|nr:hypothetical protein [Nitrosopumilaceae archaeon]
MDNKDFEECKGRYMSRSEMEKFKMDCPVCGITVNLLEFAGHVRKYIDNLKK